MVYQENANDEEEHPFLRKIEANISIACNDIWNTCKTGTLIQMNHVNLSGLGDVAVEALSRKLSNYFSCINLSIIYTLFLNYLLYSSNNDFESINSFYQH